ncbi:MAG TPA: hypothetical protein VH186_11275 [Chloroflexia bacterium]|nr:hypothetical protein [Chloroflexia bacterium]
MANSDVQNFSDRLRNDPSFRQNFLNDITGHNVDPGNKQLGGTIANFAKQNGFNISDNDAKQLYDEFADQQASQTDADLSDADLAGVAGGTTNVRVSSK